MNAFQCIKPGCGTRYETAEDEAYYCPPCNEMRKEIAKQIDAQIASRPRKPIQSELQEYDNTPKIRGFVHVKL